LRWELGKAPTIRMSYPCRRSKVARDEARVAVIGAADVHADHQADGLAAVEVGDRLGTRGARQEGESEERESAAL
jgi:hypothetical protein